MYTLTPEADAARVNLGGDWRMPTEAEWNELFSPRYCKWQWTHNYNGSGESGYVVTSKKNGNSIFLPSTGYVDGYRCDIYQGQNLIYWLRDGKYRSHEGQHAFAHGQTYDSDYKQIDAPDTNHYSNSMGLQVRAVCPNPNFGKGEKQKPAKMHEAEAVDLGLSVLWASCDLGSTDGISEGEDYAYGATEPYTIDNRGPAKFNPDCYQKNEDKTYTLRPSADAASVNMGGDWRIPTKAEWEELADTTLCKWKLTFDYNGTGVSGYIVTSRINGNSIFLPAPDRSKEIAYWSSSYVAEAFPPGYESATAFSVCADYNCDYREPHCSRTKTRYGLPIRAVRPRPQ